MLEKQLEKKEVEYGKQEDQPKIYCRWAPSLGNLESDALSVWGTPPYDPEKHLDDSVVFFGMYGLSDFLALQKHRGKAYVLWCGSDIRHLQDGYWLDKEGKARVDPIEMAKALAPYEHWVENDTEYFALLDLGIDSYVCPSFLGDTTGYPQGYQHSPRPKLYTSVSGDNFKLYGWDKALRLARAHPSIDFHFYGNTVPPWNYREVPDNVFVHGRVPKEQMNVDIATMQGALRMTEFDGFSEILAKSVLMEQYPVSLIPYPHMLKPSQVEMLHSLYDPNVSGREHYQKILNKYPWNQK